MEPNPDREWIVRHLCPKCGYRNNLSVAACEICDEILTERGDRVSERVSALEKVAQEVLETIIVGGAFNKERLSYLLKYAGYKLEAMDITKAPYTSTASKKHDLDIPLLVHPPDRLTDIWRAFKPVSVYGKLDKEEHSYYFCPHCSGWIEGTVTQKYIDTGEVWGWVKHCLRCGKELSFMGHRVRNV